MSISHLTNYPTLSLHPVLLLVLPTRVFLLPWEDFPYGNTQIILEMVITNGHVSLHLVCLSVALQAWHPPQSNHRVLKRVETTAGLYFMTHLCWLGLFSNMTQPRVILEEGISIEKMTSSYWQVCGAFFFRLIIGMEGPNPLRQKPYLGRWPWSA